ncbi:MAG: DUF11 domain-containing protein [Gammaproteobacteria bacterium]|nr:DUF11 domain-containing protein [Gammaproteobacteria bacterium]MBU1968364.1 DUF11 domain-containing protein [Gammaproteobacteria bacterium]
MKKIIKTIFVMLALLAGTAEAAVCTSLSAGNWNWSGRWSCGHVPNNTDDVVIAHNITMNTNPDIVGFTINAGATLDDNGNDLTVTGSVLINGTYDGSGNNGNLIMEGNGQTLSGTGTIIDIGRIQIDANTTIPAGSNLNLTLDSEIRVGDQNNATLTIDGIITGTGQNNGNRIIRLDNNNTSNVILNGTINAPNSYIEIQDGGTFANNGTVTLRNLDGNGDATSTWTQGANSSLTLTQPAVQWVGTFNANAGGNTVTYNGTSTVIAPSAGYWNLAGTIFPAACPVPYTIQGANPCIGAPTVTTNAATSLTTTGAMLNGTVSDNGAATTVTFEYGIGAYDYTVTATQSPLAAGSGSTGVSVSLNGLPCGTTYDFHAVGVNSYGTTYGANLTFTTAACPTGVSVTANPTACVDATGIGTRTWGTLTGPLASDNAYASASVDGSTTHFLKCTGYGFAIPATAPVVGIVVNVERKSSSTANGGSEDAAMRLVRADVIQAVDRSSATTYTTADVAMAHGGATDLWGGWTAAEINLPTFGAAFAATKPSNNGGAHTITVDHMPITVYYTPTVPWVASINRVSPNPTVANTSVSWDVLFSGDATGVDAMDFALVMGGAATGATITGVTGSGRVWTVTANTGTGATGTLGLNLVDNDSIIIGGVPLGGAGLNNGDFAGQIYTLEVPVCGASAIFCDDFERANPGAVGNGWTITPGPGADCNGVVGNSGCAGIDTDIPPFNATTNRANPTRSMFTRWSVVTVESRTIDLSTYPSALLSFWMRRGGDSFSEYPEAVGEDYLVKYLASDNTWKVLAQYPTGVMQGQVFTPVIQLPADAMHANFKLQFYQPAGSGDANGGATGGAPGVVGYDYWHFDNVIITEAPESSYTGAFCDNFEAGLGRWSISAEGAPPTAAIGDADLRTTDFLSATHELDLRWGYVVVSTLRTDMTGVSGDIVYWVKSGTTATRDPDANEDLVVEYRNSSGAWTNLATYPGSAAAGTIYNASHVLPADAQHTGFRLRFRQLNGSSFDNDYWHIDDVCVGTPQANADLSITKSRSGPLVPGSNGTYILTVTNNGPQDMSGTIQVVDTLPAGLGYYSGIGTGWTCTWNAPDVTCSYVGSLANGASAPPITLTVAVDAGATGTITNTATVSGTVTDTVSANNTATNTTTLTPGFVYTDGPCVHGIAFGGAGQTCNILSWSSLTAGQDFTNVYITAVNTSSVPNQLSGASATTVNMEFGLSCHNPAADAGVQATFSATASALELCEPNGGAPANWTTGVDLSFAATNPSVGPYTFNYADVGQVELYARNSAAATQVGQSGPFVVRPAGFVLSQIRCTTADANNCGAGALPSGNNPAAFATGGLTFIRAGDPFSVTVTAINTLGNATPNYGHEATPETVLLTPANVLANMATAPAITGTFGSFTSGVATGTAFAWGEVGIVTLTPSVGDGNYLGAGNVTGTTSGNVGRFYPHHFDTVVSQVAGVPMGCPDASCPATYNGIAYSGQTFALTVTAMNAAGGVTSNYNATTGLAKMTSLTVVGNLGTDDAVTGAGWLGVASMSAFAAGTITSNTEAYTFSAVSAPSNIYIRATEATGGDGVTSKRLVDPTGTSVEGGVQIVSGRLKVSNAYGSERLPLGVTATVQYWDGNNWLVSTTDNVTSFNTATNLTKAIISGTLAAANINAVGGGDVTVASGLRSFTLAAPGVTGSADIGLDAPTYLQTGSVLGRVTFGVYSNRNNYIYRREN